MDSDEERDDSDRIAMGIKLRQNPVYQAANALIHIEFKIIDDRIKPPRFYVSSKGFLSFTFKE